MSGNHTKGLLRQGQYGRVIDSNSNTLKVLGFALCGSNIAEANSERIVSCWNACEGVDQETLEGGWTAKGMSDYAKSLEQRLDKTDELLNTIYESGDLRIRMERLVQNHLTVPREAIDKQFALNAQSSADLHRLFCEAISWGMVYGPKIAAEQWDEMRDGKASSLASTYMSQESNAGSLSGQAGD